MSECEVCRAECGARRYCDDECSGYAQGRQQGERETIARVVAWMRRKCWDDADMLADAIERGTWREGGE